MATKRFSKRANFMLSPLDVAMLGELAEHHDVSGSDVVRMLIKSAHREVFKGRSPQSKPEPTEGEILAKAIQHYLRKDAGEIPSQPSQSDSDVKGSFVQLANVNGDLARYRYDVDAIGKLHFSPANPSKAVHSLRAPLRAPTKPKAPKRKR